MTTTTPTPGNDTGLPERPTLSDCSTTATFLHGLLQGLQILLEEAHAGNPATPASNACTALADEMVAKASRLVNDLERVQ
ncbi:hypothetical protein GEU84_000560 [Fertoebacter nigrum]|uniref:Uncharacterized protein n=1 Tax=Fertoeibacter niger TaxID=2656921 RepID=A0A8X8KPD9_9RHOB|nr:hypothetical protein [Fertoeibacter niger]NUB42862.1 hypothetical protein [Fertoeibacter niger]